MPYILDDEAECLASDERLELLEDIDLGLEYVYRAIFNYPVPTLSFGLLEKAKRASITCIESQSQPLPARSPLKATGLGRDAIFSRRIREGEFSASVWAHYFRDGLYGVAPHGRRFFHMGTVERWIGRGEGRPDDNTIDWDGVELIEYRPGHWGCYLNDQSCSVDNLTDTDEGLPADVFRRSEIISLVCLLRSQIHHLYVDSDEEQDAKYNGVINATVVSFTHFQARVVQASCDLTCAEATIILSHRATYDLGTRDGKILCTYDTAMDILHWLVDPPEPSVSFPRTLGSPTPKKPSRRAAQEHSESSIASSRDSQAVGRRESTDDSISSRSDGSSEDSQVLGWSKVD